METISLCLMVKNEEKYIERCIESVKDIVDDIVILDTGSIDKTVKIASKYTDNILYKKFNDNFSDMRNYLISKAKTDWILFLDADEHIIKNEAKKIRELIREAPKDVGAFKFYVYNFFATGGWFSGQVIRLFRNDRRFKYDKKVSERIENSIINTKLKIQECDILLNHSGYCKPREIRYNKAKSYVRMYKDQLCITPHDYILYSYIGVNLKTFGELDEALKYTEIGVTNLPDSRQAYMFYGHTLRSLNRNEEALVAFKKALECGSEDSSVLNMIGVMYLTLKDFDNSTKYFKQAYEKNKTLIHCLLNLGIAYFYMEEYDAAINSFKKVIDRNPYFLNSDIDGILEYDPYRATTYETVINYQGLESYLLISNHKSKTKDK